MALNSNFRTLTADNIEGIVEDRNYLKSSFENGTITGWTEVAVALTSGLPTGTPTIGATAASSLALSATSVTPLSGSRSLLVDVPSALTAGHGFISDEFTLDRMDLGKVLTVSFDYERVSGTYNFSGTLGSQTWMVYIYDSTAGGANWIQPAGFLGMNQSSGPGRIRATFQSSVTAGQKYRVAVIASQAASGSSSIEFDNFTCSRQTAPIGPVVTDWVSYTPTGSWTSNVTYTGQWRRVGDSMEINAQVVCSGAPNAANLTFNLPSGYSIDIAKLPSNAEWLLGHGTINDVGVQGYDAFALYNNQTSFRALFKFANLTQVTFGSAQISNTAPFTFGNTDTVAFNVKVPITGWSSNVQLSNDTDTRVVALTIYSGTTQSIASQGAEGSEPIFTAWTTTATVDTHSGWLGGGQYRIPVSGQYLVNAKINKAGATANSFAMIVKAYKNGTPLSNRFSRYDQPAISQAQLPLVGSEIYTLNAGDVIDLRIFQNSGSALLFGAESTALVIQRLSGPSVVAASETVACKYSVEGARAPTHASEVIVAYDTKHFDTHNMARGVGTSGFNITAPVSGTYQVSFSVSMPGKNAVNQTYKAQAFLNGSSVFTSGSSINYYAGLSADTNTSAGAALIKLNAGEYIDIRFYTFRSDGTVSNYMVGGPTQVSFVRVGN